MLLLDRVGPPTNRNHDTIKADVRREKKIDLLFANAGVMAS